MHLKYTHYFGNESSEELLESYGIETNKDKKQLADALLRPKQCPNCSESNIPDSKFCSKCRMVLTYDAFSETLEIEKEKDNKITSLEQKINELENRTRTPPSPDILSKIKEFEQELDNFKIVMIGKKQKQQLIKAAGRAAFYATTRKRKRKVKRR